MIYHSILCLRFMLWPQGIVTFVTIQVRTFTLIRFLIPSSERLKHNGEHLSHLGDLQCRGRSWALHAGKKVLQSVDEPDFASIQTCEVLSLYWFSQGDSQRNTMFCGMTLTTHVTLPAWLTQPRHCTEGSLRSLGRYQKFTSLRCCQC